MDKKLFLLIGLGLLLGGCAGISKRAPLKLNIATQRTAALDDLFVLQSYRAGKNSFVESPERHTGTWTGKGYRYTLLEREGQGSIRHIWSTRGGGEPYFDWEFYIDGETTPSIRGTDVDIIRAAQQVRVPAAPGNSVPLGNMDYNLYLPIPFEKSIRIDVVQRQPSFWLWFCQIDYRLEDNSMAGARLFSQGEGKDLTLSYVGMPQQHRLIPASNLPREQKKFKNLTLRPGEMLAISQMKGSGIVRELRLKRPLGSNLRLRIRYDGSDTYSVDSPVEPFFGPFRSPAFFRHKPGDSSCYLPMPFQKSCDVLVVNEATESVKISGFVEYESTPGFSPAWGYFHAKHQRTDKTNGHRLHQVLYVRGEGHWVGMTLFKTGHDHGGGDFAVIDGEGDTPAFLHGVNGEDYFTFAWFGKGAHHPYAEAHSNDEGRYRLHLENPYPFTRSLALEWGAFANLSPESVAFWYQTSPEDTTVLDGAREDSVEWDVFGPVPIPHDKVGHATVELFSVLPSVADLDAGKKFDCKLINEKFTSGWNKDWTVGPMLNLTYIARHGSDVGGEIELGGMGHAFLARRFVESDTAKTVQCQFAHDDPIEVWVNGKLAFIGEKQFNGFENTNFPIHLIPGKNEIVVKLTNYFNRDFNWTGFLMKGEGL